MFGDRLKRKFNVDEYLARTLGTNLARVLSCPPRIPGVNDGEHTLVPSYKWFEESQRQKDMYLNCGFGICNRNPNQEWICWLHLYPEHRCKYKLTLSRE